MLVKELIEELMKLEQNKIINVGSEIGCNDIGRIVLLDIGTTQKEYVILRSDNIED